MLTYTAPARTFISKTICSVCKLTKIFGGYDWYTLIDKM